MTILGIDYGEKRIGIAVSDISEKIAFSVCSLERENSKNDLERIKKVISEKNVRMVLTGMPLNMDGTSGKKAAEVESFCEWLRENLNIEVITWDERLSTVEAERVLIESKMSGRKRRKVIDKLAAQIILQSYLDADKRR